MRNRDAVLEYQKVLDDAGTLVKDLDIVDPVSALYLEHEATNGTTSNKGNFISDIITKVEIVDGAEVLYSLNLSELEALHFYKLGKTPPLFPSEWASGAQRHGCLLMFGRHLWDQEYAIDFTKFRNPQLKITSNLAAIRAVAADTAFATGTLKCSIVAKVLEGSGAPGKYLMAKELLSFTSSSSSGAEERKELPLDLVYRMLMTRHWVQGSDIDEVTSDLKLTADADKYIAFNRKVRQLDAEALTQFGTSRLKHDFFESHQDKVRLLHNKEPDCRPFYQLLTAGRMVGIDYQWSSEAKFNIIDDTASADTTDRKYTMVEEGHALHATLPLPFGDMMRPETWFDPTAYKKLELVFKSGGTAGACAVVAEQVRPN
jgi:hypothetical protein